MSAKKKAVADKGKKAPRAAKRSSSILLASLDSLADCSLWQSGTAKKKRVVESDEEDEMDDMDED